MRMALCWPSLLFLYALHIQVAIATYILSPELTNFIPSCAQDCFKSFLDVNFPTAPCGTTPTLGCLCSHNSTTGYAVGEGAVQCIISEDGIGFCKGNDAKDSVAISAYNMCIGQADALPNTHGTITATLFVPTSMPSIVLVAPASTTISVPISTTSSPSTKIVTSFVTKTTSSASVSASNTVSSTISSIVASQTAVPNTPLSKSQVVVITVASVGGGCVAIGLIILFCFVRRRRQRKLRESHQLPFQLDPPAHLMERGKYKYSFKGPLERKPGGTANGVAARVAPPIPPRLDTSSSNMFSRRSIRPDTIGLAISPESNTTSIQRRPSRLLPEKPSLKLKMPQSPPKAGISFLQPLGGPRESTATDFEEDDFDSADTAVNADDSWGRTSIENILDKTTAAWPNTKVKDPKPAVPQFVDGGEGYHWRPPKTTTKYTPAPDYYIKPLELSRGVGSFSQPRRPDEYPRPPEQTLQLAIPKENARPITAGSSVYSARVSQPGSENGRQNAPRPRKSYRQSGPYDSRQSGGSLTSFDSMTSGFSPIESAPRTGAMDLSPVVESPTSQGGLSPVTYPNIPKRLSGTIRAMPPPPQPNFKRAVGASTAGVVQQPWRQAELVAQRERERVYRQSQEPARAAARELQIQIGMQGIPQRPKPAAQSQPQGQGQGQPSIYRFPTPPSRFQPVPLSLDTSTPVSRAQQFNTQQQQQRPQQQPQFQRSQQPQPQPQFQRPPQPQSKQPLQLPQQQPTLEIPYPRSSSQQSSHSQASKFSKASASSSLLAKRLGEQKAATLMLPSKSEEEKATRKWRVLEREDIEEAKKKGWKPMLGIGVGGSGRGDNAGNGVRGEEVAGGGRGRVMEQQYIEPPPTTPGWMPRLTPTRRGDELFLSVQ